MESVLVKILAVVLALSQVSTRPDEVRTHFDATTDRAAVLELLRGGCAHMRKVFEIESLALDDLVETALADPTIATSKAKAFHGINFADLPAVYRELCKNETPDPSPVDIGQVIEFYNKAATDLPDHARLKGLRLGGPSKVLDGKGGSFTELYSPGSRRIPVPLADIPEVVQRAFIAAEDQRFYEHKGIDERGLVRAFVVNMMQPGRPQGGSTITQQMVKNLLVGDDVTYERKVREIIVTARIERTLSKPEILALYLNSIYFGRNSWGVEMAARSYFGKSIKDVSVAEGALLAGLVKGPNYFSPDRAPERARERLGYVLGRMQEDGVIPADEAKRLEGKLPAVIPPERPREEVARNFFDYLSREAKTLPGVELANASYTIHSTIYPELQRATEAALQEGLAQYELSTGRLDFQGPEANLAEAVKQLAAARGGAAPGAGPRKPDWQEALAAARLPLSDVHWTPAILIDKGGRNGGPRVGLADGRVLALRAYRADIQRRLQLYDVVYVRVVEGGAKTAAHADLRVRPVVQGAALVLDNKTGRILAMVGGFSSGLSQLNRTVQSRRQPGSAIKPITYLAALRSGLQPNTLIRDEPVTLPPINGSMRDRDYWSPKNYDGGSWGVVTLRRALENSRNLATVGLLDGGIESSPERSLDRVCELAQEAQLYAECQHYYPIVLGAQPVRMIDLAAFYAAIANEGARPTPHAIASVEQDGRTVYRDDVKAPVWLGSADRVAFYQLKTMLQGVVLRGTANSIRQLGPYVAGKTGTSENENDAWFVGFTNDVTVAVWLGYDNGGGNGRRTLGANKTGGHVAVPIFKPIIEATWATYARQAPLAPPSPEVKRQIVTAAVDPRSGTRVADGPGAITETFRLGSDGRLDDTQYRIVSEYEVGTTGYEREGEAMDEPPGFPYYGNGQRYQAVPQSPAYPSYRRGLFGGWFFDDSERAPPMRERRYDPDYYWSHRLN
ncbi:MAG TPA: transglycosylase domain-containing protein [Xanthobacteraceae bacterium]|nr:transglycosylase domain-containing protein [Xanthobacteraceae bacterium]